MSNADILAMFDEAPDDVTPASMGGSAAVVTDEAVDTAIRVDRWGRRIAERLTDEWNLPKEDTPAVSDARTACFEPRPQLVHSCTNELRHRWYQDLMKTPDYAALHATTRMNVQLSEIAARDLMDRWEAYDASVSDEEREEATGDPEDESIAGQMKRQRNISKAVQKAAQNVSEARQAAESFGFGDEAGEDGGTDAQAVLKAFKAIQSNPQLRAISEHAGRFIQLGRSMQRQKPVHGMDDVVGIELAGDVNRLVVSELMMLTDEDLELDLLRRITEKQAMCTEYKAVESVGRGPIMVLVDESASMRGDSIAAAKGFALAMSWLAKHQRRWCCLVGWSSAGQVRELLIEPGRSSSQIMHWCSQMWDGGTHPPLSTVPQLFEATGAPDGKTDVIWVTDGECVASGVNAFNQWRKDHNVKVWTIGIDTKATSFYSFSDVTTTVSSLNTGEPIIGELLSL